MQYAKADRVQTPLVGAGHKLWRARFIHINNEKKQLQLVRRELHLHHSELGQTDP